MYKIEFTNSAAKELGWVFKRDKKLYGRFCQAIEDIAKDPFQGKRLKGPLSQEYSLRVGDYRVNYTVYKEKLVVYIIDLGHRREIYRIK